MIALLNVGSEEIKGTDNKKAHSLLKEISKGDFIFNGYIEGNEILKEAM